MAYFLSSSLSLSQAEDRAHRIGQASSVNIHYLHLRGSVDDLIWRLLQRKLTAVGEMLDGQGDKLVTSTPGSVSAASQAEGASKAGAPAKKSQTKSIATYFQKKA